MILDSHQHFWRYNPGEYAWIDKRMAELQRDFLPGHLMMEASKAGVNGVISVQARQSLEETQWLLMLAQMHDYIKGIVGWVPLTSAKVSEELVRLADEPKFKGVRHVLQDESDDHYLLRADFNAGIDSLLPLGLVYDLLITERQLPRAIEFVDRHPKQPFVLDHLAKPKVRDGETEPWARNIRELAKREHVSCKISGLATEADWHEWRAGDIEPYFETVLEAFGADRLMFGSDWPVCLNATSYVRWLACVKDLAARLSEAEQAQIFGKTAASVYSISSDL